MLCSCTTRHGLQSEGAPGGVEMMVDWRVTHTIFNQRNKFDSFESYICNPGYMSTIGEMSEVMWDVEISNMKKNQTLLIFLETIIWQATLTLTRCIYFMQPSDKTLGKGKKTWMVNGQAFLLSRSKWTGPIFHCQVNCHCDSLKFEGQH